jgi:predicted PurR-regulated permease PerM
MLIWGVLVASVDQVVKPWFISQGSDMPFILIVFGVLGGAMTFGFIGVFLGPTLLAVGFRLLEEWSPATRALAEEVKNPETGANPRPDSAKSM